jgi:succinylglutamate desuccinylase
VDGALLEYLNNFGVTTIGVEAGQHDHPESPRRHEAVLWLALASVGLIDPRTSPDLDECRRFLRRVRSRVPRVVEVRQRHAIGDRDLYRMEPGFVNFDPVRRGQKLATDRSGPVLAAENGIVLLPLYQGKGEDGFFVARAVKRVWLRVSRALRRVGIGSVLHWLPGVRRKSGSPEVLVVDTRIARYCPLDVFHLFGYRKLRRNGARLVVTRRRFDLAPPARVSLRGD